MLVSVEIDGSPVFRAVVRGNKRDKESSAELSPLLYRSGVCYADPFFDPIKAGFVVNDSVYHFGAAAGSRAPVDR